MIAVQLALQVEGVELLTVRADHDSVDEVARLGLAGKLSLVEGMALTAGALSEGLLAGGAYCFWAVEGELHTGHGSELFGGSDLFHC